MAMSFQEKRRNKGSTGGDFRVLLLFVFLILAALYEAGLCRSVFCSSTPVALFGAFGVLWLRRVLLGMFLPAYRCRSKRRVLANRPGHAHRPQPENAILIVEFARTSLRKARTSSAPLSTRLPDSADFDDVVRVYSCACRYGPRRRPFRRPPDHGNHRDCGMWPV